jgi:hypothetical protein
MAAANRRLWSSGAGQIGISLFANLGISYSEGTKPDY